MARKKILTTTLAVRNYFNGFLHNQSIGGIILVIFAAIALLCANVPHLDFVQQLWKTEV